MNRKTLLRAIVVVLIGGALVAAFLTINTPESFGSKQGTDDAYVQADFTVIVPQIAGVITGVDVTDHQQVAAGTSLVTIDDRDLRIALDRIRADVASAEAAVESFHAQLSRHDSAIEQARATVAASTASVELAEINLIRFTKLARDGSGTVQAQQQAEAERDVQQAVRARDEAGLKAAQQQTEILRAELKRARAALLAAVAQEADATLNLSYTRVIAPVSGVVAQRTARVGGYARVGEPLLTLVPLDALYVEANFRETQLAQVEVGQPVDITVDALPGVRLKGWVASLGPASGVSFSPLPPHNATGNFTKIVQRLPVRIRLQRDQESADRLRVGMSVRPTINVSAKTADPQRAHNED